MLYVLTCWSIQGPSDSLSPHSFFPVAVPDTVQVMHSQINLLRQTILDLQQTEAQEMADVRRQIDALKPGANDASDRFNDFDARLQDMEQQPRGSGMVRDSRLNTIILAFYVSPITTEKRERDNTSRRCVFRPFELVATGEA